LRGGLDRSKLPANRWLEKGKVLRLTLGEKYYKKKQFYQVNKAGKPRNFQEAPSLRKRELARYA